MNCALVNYKLQRSYAILVFQQRAVIYISEYDVPTDLTISNELSL